MGHFFRCHRVGFGNHGNNIHLSKIVRIKIGMWVDVNKVWISADIHVISKVAKVVTVQDDLLTQ